MPDGWAEPAPTGRAFAPVVALPAEADRPGTVEVPVRLPPAFVNAWSSAASSLLTFCSSWYAVLSQASARLSAVRQADEPAVPGDGEPVFPEWTGLAVGPAGEGDGAPVDGPGRAVRALAVGSGQLGVRVLDGVGDGVALASTDGCGAGTAPARHIVEASARTVLAWRSAPSVAC